MSVLHFVCLLATLVVFEVDVDCRNLILEVCLSGWGFVLVVGRELLFDIWVWLDHLGLLDNTIQPLKSHIDRYRIYRLFVEDLPAWTRYLEVNLGGIVQLFMLRSCS